MNRIIGGITLSIILLCSIAIVIFTVKIHDMFESRNQMEIGYIEALRVLATRNYDSKEEIALKGQLQRKRHHHINIYYDPTQRTLLSDAISALQEATRENQQLIGDYPTPQVDLILFQNEEQFRQHAHLTNTNGYYADFDKLIGILPLSTNNSDGFQKESFRYMVKHEYSHYALLQKIQAMGFMHSTPEWFLEGYAEYVSFIHVSPFMQTETTDTIIPFENLENSEQWKHLRTAGAVDPYRQSQEAIWYIIHEFGDESILNILKAAEQTESFEQAIHRSTGLTYDDLENHIIRSRHE